MSRQTLALLTALLALIANSSMAVCADQNPTINFNDLNGAYFNLFTNPEGCVPCAELEAALKKSKQQNVVYIKSGGQTIALKIVKFDPWDPKADQKKLTTAGFKNTGIPQFAIIKNGKVLGSGIPTGSFIDINPRQRQDLLPNANEDLLAYHSRVIKFYSDSMGDSYDISDAVLESVGLYERQIKPNADFHVNLDSANILIAGTARTPFDNPIFTGVVIKKVISALSAISYEKPTLLYGGGDTNRCDTCQLRPGKDGNAPEGDTEAYLAQRQFVHVQDLKANESFTSSNLRTFFEVVKTKKTKRNLVVLVGHGTEEGAITWFENKVVTPSDLKKMSDLSGSQNILISGNCYGGQMAQAMACGFMAAPPDKPAAGCWEDAESDKLIPDYISMYFKSLNDKAADTSGDGKVSFLEAHSYATSRVDAQDTPYTTMDDLAEKYFASTPDAVIEGIRLSKAKGLLAGYVADTSEVILLNKLSEKLNNDSIISVKTLKVRANFEGVIEASVVIDDAAFAATGNYILEQVKVIKPEAFRLPKEVLDKSKFSLTLNGGKAYIRPYLKVEDPLANIVILEVPDAISPVAIVNQSRLRMLVRRLLYKSYALHDRALKEKVDQVRACEDQNIQDFLKAD